LPAQNYAIGKSQGRNDGERCRERNFAVTALQCVPNGKAVNHALAWLSWSVPKVSGLTPLATPK